MREEVSCPPQLHAVLPAQEAQLLVRGQGLLRDGCSTLHLSPMLLAMSCQLLSGTMRMLCLPFAHETCVLAAKLPLTFQMTLRIVSMETSLVASASDL